MSHEHVIFMNKLPRVLLKVNNSPESTILTQALLALKDIAYLLTTYENIPTITDQLYREATLMERYGWDITLASAHQLGINVKQITLPQTQSVISKVLGML